MTTGTALTRRWRAAALPALIATVPLVGMSLQGDERPRVYSVISRYSSNPFKMRGPQVLSEAAETGSPPRSFRLALALALIGAAGASLSALLASLVTVVQNIEPRAIDAWRETLLTQVAWSFLISACLAATLGAVRYRSSRQIAVGLAAALLAASLTATLLANWRMAQADRQTPLSSITSQISAAVINLDTTENGNARRCSLIDAYSELVPDHLNMGGPAVQEHLDHLMLQRHGWPFCDRTRY